MRYFTLDELCRSATATRLGIDNMPTEAIKRNLVFLVSIALDPLREVLGQPLYINCAYRCPALNKAVGGSKTSAHLQGLAADTHIRGNNRLIYDSMIKAGLPFDQIIMYDSLRNPRFVHIGISRVKNRGEVLFSQNGRYVKIN